MTHVDCICEIYHNPFAHSVEFFSGGFSVPCQIIDAKRDVRTGLVAYIAEFTYDSLVF